MVNKFQNKILSEKLKTDKKRRLIFNIFFILFMLSAMLFFYKVYFVEYIENYSSLKSEVIKDNKINSAKNLEADEFIKNVKDKNFNTKPNFNNEVSGKNIIENGSLNNDNLNDSVDKINKDTISPEQLKNSCNKLLLKLSECNIDNILLKYIGNFKNILEPELNNKNASAFFLKELNYIDNLKNQSLSHYSLEENNLALEKIILATEHADKILIKINTILVNSMADAKIYFDDFNYILAKSEISKAMKIDATNENIIDLNKRIKVLPKIITLKDKLNIAQVENNIKEEANILKEIISIDSKYKNYNNRLNSIIVVLNKNIYSKSIVKSYDFIKKKDLKSLNIEISKAKNLFPNGIELIDLMKKSVDLEKEISLGNYLALAEDSIDRDDWASSLLYFNKALLIDERSLVAQEGIKLCRSILSSNKTIQGFINRPDRLSSTKIKNSALEALKESSMYIDYSALLKRNKIKLEELVKKYNVQYKINIISDNNTDIYVRGVGKVGKTIKKVIMLKTGSYFFEGRRQGYKTKLIKLEVMLEDLNYIIEVICNESI